MRYVFAILLLSAVFAQAQDSLYLSFDDALNTVIAHNSDVQEAKYEWISRKEMSSGAYGDFEPQLVGRMNKERADRPSALFTETKDEYKISVQGNLPTGTQYDVGFNQATYTHSDYTSELYFGGELRQHLLKDGPIYFAPTNNLRQAKLQQEVAYQKYRNTLTDIIENFCDAYWNYYYSQQILVFATKSADVAKEIVDDASKRLSLGLLSPLDYQKAVAEYSDRESARLEALDKLRSARLTLLLSLSSSEYMQDTRPIAIHPDFSIDSSILLDTKDLQDSIKMMHPVYLYQKADLELRETVLSAHKSSFLPTLDLIGSYGIRSRDDNARTAVHNFKETKRRQTVLAGGIEYVVPLFANIKERHQMAAEKANVRSSEMRLSLVLDKLLEEFRILRKRTDEVRSQFQYGETSVDFHKKELEEEFKKMKLGKSNYHQIFDIEEDLQEAQRRHLETIRMLHVIDIRASKAKGKLLLQNKLEKWHDGKLLLREDLLSE